MTDHPAHLASPPLLAPQSLGVASGPRSLLKPFGHASIANANADEREAFEGFAKTSPMGEFSVTRHQDGYRSSHTQIMWDTWQARAALAAARHADDCAELEREHLGDPDKGTGIYHPDNRQAPQGAEREAPKTINFRDAANRFGRREGSKWIFDDLALSLFASEVARAALSTSSTKPVCDDPDLTIALMERLEKTMVRLGISTGEGGMEHFRATLLDQLYALCRGVDSLFDSLAATEAPKADPAPASAPEGVREALRTAQAEAVMPLIGPLLDAWENVDREALAYEPDLVRWLKAIDSAMEDAEPASPAAEVAAPLDEERIAHLQQTHVGEPSPSYPICAADWLNFARAIERAHGIGVKLAGTPTQGTQEVAS